MDGIRCHRCGGVLPEGSLKYQVEVRVRSCFDGVIPLLEGETQKQELDRIMADVSACTEEDLTRQIYEDDVFLMCPACKEAFMNEIYSHLLLEAPTEEGRAHLIN
jgi:phage FluMu protein Com